MTDQSEQFSLAADDALEEPVNDQLGYDDFASHIAEVIQRKTPEDEFIIGIYGDWGSGKSTVLNFIEYYLENQTDESPLTVRFNPWWFSGQHDLFEKYLQELASALGEDRFDELREKLATYAKTLSKTPTGPIAEAKAAQKGLEIGGELLDPEASDLGTLKEDISSELASSDKPIVVLIDDIDRLTNDEIQQMFRLAKSVADFPNITYVLGFDYDIVAEALDDEGMNGDDYLKKIVQLPVNLPEPQKHAIQDIFLTNIEEALGPDWEPHLEERWTDVFQNGIRLLLDTPRAAVRLSNAIKISYSMFDPDEINVTDLVGIETLRVFYPDVYEKIRTQPDRFIGIDYGNSPALSMHYDDEDEETEEYAELFSNRSASEESPLKTLLGNLFPKCGEEFEGSFLREPDTYRKRRRICHSEIYRLYFQLAVPQEGISVRTIKQLIQTDDPEAFYDQLTDLAEETTSSGRTKAHIFLSHLSEYTEDIGTDHIPVLIEGLFRISDKLLEADRENDIPAPNNRYLLNQLIQEMLRRVDQDQRDDLLIGVIDSEYGLYLQQEITTSLSKQHGFFDSEAFPTDDRLLTEDQLEAVQDSVIDNIANTAESNDLLQLQRPYSVFAFWYDLSQEDASEWLESTTSDTDGLLQCLNRILIDQDPPRWKADPEWVDDVFGLDNTVDRLEEIDTETLDEDQETTVTMFLKGKEFFDQGGNPHRPGTFDSV
ncbi:KAP family P-loop NTPase fold protein [Halomicrobium salinisoli]|uniref:KAP family P-loop NTPase fold protein n=1 Tax=Halomicrobium salinisoli TaxID=2878391 RepID=UPI001CF0A035|nr:P-loop NTPase fold protein [Halomicrobium salinisoli]